MHIRVAARNALVALLAALFGVTPLWAHPEKGTLAPPLDSLSLLQAPAGAKADWASLKGKVVVLEFWATWCSPCVASLPHLNELVATLDPAKFQFVSIDDEDVGAVKTFLARKKIDGWVGVDASGKVLAAYGVNSRPTTVIVNGNGRVVAVTQIDSVNAADLRRVAEGKSVAFKPLAETVETTAAPAATAERALFSVSVTKASPDAKPALVKHPPTGSDWLGQDADGLMTNVCDTFSNRYVLKAPLPGGRFDVRVNAADVPAGVTDAVVQQAVLAALHLRIEPRTVRKPAYILRATEASKGLLSP